MVYGAYKRNYRNENVNELKDKLFKEFMFKLKDSNDVEICLYILNEEFEDDQGATKYNKYEVSSSLFLDRGFSIDSSLKTAMIKRNTANGKVFKDFRDLVTHAVKLFRSDKENDNLTRIEIIRKFLWDKNAKQQELYIKEVDGVECLFTKARLSNKAKRRLLSGKYMLGIHTLVWPKIDVVGDKEKSTDKELHTKLVETSELQLIIAMFVKYVKEDKMPNDFKKKIGEITPVLKYVKRKQN